MVILTNHLTMNLKAFEKSTLRHPKTDLQKIKLSNIDLKGLQFARQFF